MTLDVGSSYVARLNVTNAAGQPVNPSTAVLTVTFPDQTSAGLNVTLPPAVTGTLLSDPLISSQAGLHKFSWVTTGPVVAKVNYENFRSYISAIGIDDAKDRLGLTKSNRDEQVRALCAVATREVEKVVGILVPRVFTDEFVPGTYRDVIRVSHGPIFDRNSVTSVHSCYPGGPSWNPGDATLGLGGQLVISQRPGTLRLAALLPFWYGPWLISYKAGWNGEIPDPITEGIREVVFDLWAQYRGLSADAAEALGEQSMVAPPYYRLPPRALAAVKPYELPGFG